MVVSRTPPVAAAFAGFAAYAPIAVVRARARKRRRELAEVWPEAVDHLASAVRAGLSLPEGLTQLGERGPVPLRPAFASFGRDYTATGRFGASLDRLKAELADPAGDRVVEALRIAREVGGGDLGRMLRSLSRFLREDARTRSELEARQAWVVNGARLAVAAPWVVLLLLSFQPEVIARYRSTAGVVVIAVGAGACFVAYRLMVRLGRLPRGAAAARMTLSWWGGFLGFALGFGMLLVLRVVLAGRRPTLDSRVLPYVRDVPLVAVDRRPRTTSDHAGSALVALGRPFLERNAARLERILGGRASIQRRLGRAGAAMTVEAFRVSQVIWGLGGCRCSARCRSGGSGTRSRGSAAMAVGVRWIRDGRSPRPRHCAESTGTAARGPGARGVSSGRRPARDRGRSGRGPGGSARPRRHHVQGCAARRPRPGARRVSHRCSAVRGAGRPRPPKRPADRLEIRRRALGSDRPRYAARRRTHRASGRRPRGVEAGVDRSRAHARRSR